MATPYQQSMNQYIQYLMAAQQDPYGFMNSTGPIQGAMGQDQNTSQFLQQLGGMFGDMNGQNPYQGNFVAGPEATPWAQPGALPWWQQTPDWYNQQPEAQNAQIPQYILDKLGINQVENTQWTPPSTEIASGYYFNPETSAQEVTGGASWNPWAKMLPNISAEMANTQLGQQITDMATEGPELFNKAPDWYNKAPEWWQGGGKPSMYDQAWTSQLAPNWWKQAKRQMDPQFMQQYKDYWANPAQKELKKEYKENPYFNYSSTENPLGEDWWKALPPNWWNTWKKQVGQQSPDWWNQYTSYWQNPEAKQERPKDWYEQGWWNQYSSPQQHPEHHTQPTS